MPAGELAEDLLELANDGDEDAIAELRRCRALARELHTELWVPTRRRPVLTRSETVVHRFPIMRRLFLSFCRTRPDNSEPERAFPAMTRLLSPLRRGRMRAQTPARKMFLYLNRKYWHPCSAIRDNFYFKALLAELGMEDWLVLMTSRRVIASSFI